ncbi:phosphonate transport system substrate-binding protein [Oxalobacteraceae bacterium GrIS 1.11]
MSLSNKCVFSLCMMLASIASAAEPAATKSITFGLISTTTPEDSKMRWKPMLDDLAKATKMEVKIIVSSNYGDIVSGLKSNKIQAAWLGNKSALDAVIDGKVVVFAQMVKKDGSAGYRSVLITQKDSPIKTLGDITEKSGLYNFADGDPESTSGHLIPDFYVFAKNRLDPKTQFKRVIVGSHQKNITSVINKEVDIATNNTTELERLKAEAPDQFERIRVFWTSPLVANDPLLYRTDLPDATKKNLEDFFFTYGKQNDAHQSDVLNKILALSGFQRSSNAQLETMARLESASQLRSNANNASLSAEQKQKGVTEINERLKKLEGVIMQPAPH